MTIVPNVNDRWKTNIHQQTTDTDAAETILTL